MAFGKRNDYKDPSLIRKKPEMTSLHNFQGNENQLAGVLFEAHGQSG
jgi:hypothetical protein